MKVLLAAALCLGIAQGAYAQDVREVLTVAWESFWSQTGFPRFVWKWQRPIRVTFGGVSVERHREAAFQRLKEAAEIAGVPMKEVPANDPTANVHVEFRSYPHAPAEEHACVTLISMRNGIIQQVKVHAAETAVWRCMSHEAMHVMGIPGHPMGNTVLTYFARSGNLTEIDKLLLRTIYSDDVEPAMSPFEVLAILARRLVESTGDAGRQNAAAAADAFLRKTVQEMEQFGNGTGEAPAVLLRSSKATSAGLARGRTEIQYFLGLAYLKGHIVEANADKAREWLEKAAAASHVSARNMLERLNAQRMSDR